MLLLQGVWNTPLDFLPHYFPVFVLHIMVHHFFPKRSTSLKQNFLYPKKSPSVNLLSQFGLKIPHQTPSKIPAARFQQRGAGGCNNIFLTHVETFSNSIQGGSVLAHWRMAQDNNFLILLQKLLIISCETFTPVLYFYLGEIRRGIANDCSCSQTNPNFTLNSVGGDQSVRRCTLLFFVSSKSKYGRLSVQHHAEDNRALFHILSWA